MQSHPGALRHRAAPGPVGREEAPARALRPRGPRREVPRERYAAWPAGLWRWHELLPVPDAAYVVSLGEVETPLMPSRTASDPQDFAARLVKDEGRLPTGSFKARGLCLAVSMATVFGVRRVAIPTNGNAGAAMAAYAARGRHGGVLLLPRGYARDQPERDRAPGRDRVARQRTHQRLREARRRRQASLQLVRHVHAQGALSHRGQEDDGPGAGHSAGLATARRGLLSDRRRHRPHRHVEGVAGAAHLGWIIRPLPRLVAVQSTGCAPIVRAFEAGARRCDALGERAHHCLRHPRAGRARGFPDPARPA